MGVILGRGRECIGPFIISIRIGNIKRGKDAHYGNHVRVSDDIRTSFTGPSYSIGQSHADLRHIQCQHAVYGSGGLEHTLGADLRAGLGLAHRYLP
ncbi:hypothetical protein J6590_007600 [Homalodisca vitripennis]|nr:hypothetical protein J6590_007600 [Homalodisca vitripennis]